MRCTSTLFSRKLVDMTGMMRDVSGYATDRERVFDSTCGGLMVCRNLPNGPQVGSIL